ncbi:MAG: hypothetical protein J6K28_05280 [Alistipes sp.]|nr:hypothetical protein [Alistipes sp.]
MRIEIDNVSYPIDRMQGMSLDYDADDTGDIESGRRGRRVRLSLPSSRNTDRAFGNADDPLTAERFNAAHHTARLTADGTEIFAGTAYLLAVRKKGAETLYDIEIAGGAAGWAKAAAKRDISQAGVEFATALTPVEICKSWEGPTAVKFLPVHRDTYELRNSSVSSLPAEKILLTDDYHPFISADAVTRAIFADAGYRVESRFMDGDLFRSLYFSGAYDSTDAAARKRNMDFLAGRRADATAAADFFGRVYASASVAANSVGNIVDTVDPIITDADGKSSSSGFFSRNGCFAIENGIAVFRPPLAVKVGFEYSAAYITDHIIESRTRLRGFDTVYLGGGITVPFAITNRYEDHRENPQAGYAYKAIIFEPNDGYAYRLTCNADGVVKVVADLTARMTAVTMPAAENITDVKILRAAKGTADYEPCDEDWALYGGYVEEKGRSEVEFTVRTPAEELSPVSAKRFNGIYFSGADKGMEFTLLRRTTLRPVFTSAAGYGSRLTFADIVQHGIRQSVFLDALRHMFNLRFLTDEARKTVRIEPYDDFFAGDEVDWSDRTDYDGEIVITDTAAENSERYTLGYRGGDGAVSRFDAANGEEFGRYSRQTRLYGTKEGEKLELNPVFSPTINADGHYAAAESASVMQVCDRDDEDGDGTNFTPRIVRWAGMHPLPSGERWGYPSGGGEYPLAAFHFAGDDATEGFTLCFEDRDGLKGLHTLYDRMFDEQAHGPAVTLSLHLAPEDIAALLSGRDEAPSVRSLFRLDTGGRSALYTLRSIDGYDPSKQTTRCTFLKTSTGQ